mgnify:FL=1
MGFLDFLKRPGIDQEVEAYRKVPVAVLLDVRTREEYREGRIPGSKNVPLQEIGEVGRVVADKAVPLFVYCHSGARSSRAVSLLQQMGYTHVRNIGGIAAYSGRVER